VVEGNRAETSEAGAGLAPLRLHFGHPGGIGRPHSASRFLDDVVALVGVDLSRPASSAQTAASTVPGLAAQIRQMATARSCTAIP